MKGRTRLFCLMIILMIMIMALINIKQGGSAFAAEPYVPPDAVECESAPPADAKVYQFFPETCHYVADDFLRYWHEHGLNQGDPGFSDEESLALFGYPKTKAFVAGDGRYLQVFERAVFGYHPENQVPYVVQLRLLGAELIGTLNQDFVNAPVSGSCGMHFPETNKCMSDDFARFWYENGGLPVFGFPLTNATNLGPDWTQVFERQTFQLHPEHAGTPYYIQLALIGQQWLDGQLAGPTGPACEGTFGGSHNPETEWPINHNGPKIVNVWSPVLGEGLFKLLLGASENPTFVNVGGDITLYPAGCEKIAQEEFIKNPNPPTDLGKLAEKGLVKGAKPPRPACNVVAETSKADPSSDWRPDYQGRVAIVELWNTKTPTGKVLYFILKNDQPAVLKGGGYIWFYPGECFDQANEQFEGQKNSGNRIPTTIEKVIEQGHAYWP